MTSAAGFVDQLIAFGLRLGGEQLRTPEVRRVEAVDSTFVIGDPLWCSTGSGRLFRFDTHAIAEYQVDDNLLDVIEPIVAELGLVLVHDWNVEPQHPDRFEVGLRIWLNGEPVTFPAPEWVECVRPLELVNWLMRRAGVGEQFYFAGRQWAGGYSRAGLSGLQFSAGEVVVALLTDEMFEFLASTDGIEEDATRPIPMADVVGSVESWERR